MKDPSGPGGETNFGVAIHTLCGGSALI
ncbi:hypothetical protein [uncultured Boseongicola sp.]